MQHLDFIIWMILFPLSTSVMELINSLKPDRKEHTKEADRCAGLFIMVVWFYVGYLLF